MTADNLVIGGMAAFSTVDYPQHLAATLFLQGCPWRCHYCHNPHLIPLEADDEEITWEKARRHLKSRQGLLDAVVFSGGEPTIQKAQIGRASCRERVEITEGAEAGNKKTKRQR